MEVAKPELPLQAQLMISVSLYTLHGTISTLVTISEVFTQLSLKFEPSTL